MSVMGLFFLFIASIAVWRLAQEGVLRSPWLEEGEFTKLPAPSAATPPPAAKVGLYVFLAVAGCLFSLLAAAFFMRMDSPDWQAPPTPAILWFNTAVLIASSLALYLAEREVNRGELERVRITLAASGACAFVFLIGQVWAWRQLTGLEYFAVSNPANAFFYLLTGTHALHLIGGLFVLARTLDRAWRVSDAAALRVSIELCAIYWRFLLFVWLIMFAMLTGVTNDFGVICRRLLG